MQAFSVEHARVGAVRRRFGREVRLQAWEVVGPVWLVSMQWGLKQITMRDLRSGAVGGDTGQLGLFRFCKFEGIATCRAGGDLVERGVELGC